MSASTVLLLHYTLSHTLLYCISMRRQHTKTQIHMRRTV